MWAGVMGIDQEYRGAPDPATNSNHTAIGAVSGG